jgi:hypothetical protein
MGGDNSCDQKLKTYLKFFKTLQTPTRYIKGRTFAEPNSKIANNTNNMPLLDMYIMYYWKAWSNTQELTLTTYWIAKLQHLEPINSKPCEYSSTCIVYHHAITCKILLAFAHFSLLQPVRSFNRQPFKPL